MPAFLGFPMISLSTAAMIVDTIPSSYRMFEASEKLLAITKTSSVRNGHVVKVMNSCRPLAVNVGSFFHIKQATIMTLSRIIIDNAILMLIGF
jgi:hypothetical protein